MGIFFSKKKVTRVSDHDRAVLQLKTQRDNIKKHQTRIENTLERDRNLAKQLIADGKKDRAKLLLKKKRYQEQLLERADLQLHNLEQLVQDLEYSQIEAQVVEGLKIGNNALKKINDALNIEDIEKILDETREGIEKQKEIDELISGSLSDEDDTAIEDELSELIAQQDLVPLMPDVPEYEPEKEIKKQKVLDQKDTGGKIALGAT